MTCTPRHARRRPLDPRPAFLLAFLMACSMIHPAARAQQHEKVSVSSGCVASGAASSRGAVSANGRFVAFYSDASNLVPGDTNLTRDIFLRDRTNGTTQRISVATGGAQANGPSNRPAISASGRFVAYLSDATNLVAGDTNMTTDIFLYDSQNGTTTRVSVATGGGESNGPSNRPAISPDGRWIAFDSIATNLDSLDTNLFEDVFVHDRVTGTTNLASIGNGGTIGNDRSSRAALSTSGQFLVFKSEATNMIASDTNLFSDIFVRDMTTGTVERVSIHSNGTEADEDSTHPRITPDGRYVVFASLAQSLIPGDFNNAFDIFIHDRDLDETKRVSVDSAGGQVNGSSDYPTISDDGRFVAFQSLATNLVGGDSNLVEDVFVHDRQAGATVRVSRNQAEIQGNGASDRAMISGDGSRVVFTSFSTNLVPGDTALKDVFSTAWANTASSDCQGVDDVPVLTVNGSAGATTGYRVAVAESGSISFHIAKPVAGGNGKFLAHLNSGMPDASTVSPLPAQLGSMCFPVLIPPGGTAAPVAIWNGIGKTNRVGSSMYFGSAIPDPANAPNEFLSLPVGDPANLPLCSSWTLQAVIRNPASSSPKGHSVTNAVIIEVLP